jgi:hypothetical protein
MAQLMHDDIVRQLGRQCGDAIVKIEIASSGAAAPSGYTVFNSYTLPIKIVKSVEIF